MRKSLACEFTLTDVKHLHEALRTLQARLDAGEARPAPHGVCSALALILTPDVCDPDPYHFVHLAVEDWPEAIRNEDGAVEDYPVSTAVGFWVGGEPRRTHPADLAPNTAL